MLRCARAQVRWDESLARLVAFLDTSGGKSNRCDRRCNTETHDLGWIDGTAVNGLILTALFAHDEVILFAGRYPRQNPPNDEPKEKFLGNFVNRQRTQVRQAVNLTLIVL